MGAEFEQLNFVWLLRGRVLIRWIPATSSGGHLVGWNGSNHSGPSVELHMILKTAVDRYATCSLKGEAVVIAMVRNSGRGAPPTTAIPLWEGRPRPEALEVAAARNSGRFNRRIEGVLIKSQTE